MFRNLKEYQEIAKIYAEKVSKPENLEERRGSSVEQLKKNRETVLPATPPQKGAGGGVGNPTNVRGSGAKPNPLSKPMGAAQGRTKKPQPEIKKFPSTAEIRAANQGRVGGGNAGASTDSGGTSQSTIKSVEQKPEVKTPVKKMNPIEKRNRERMGDAKVDALKAKNAKFQAAKKSGNLAQFRKDNPKMSGADRAKQMAKERLAKKAAMEEYTPYDIVLEYLLSSEQAATIEEANYIMTEMDAETIQSIVSD